MQLEKGAAGAGPGQEFILSFVDLSSVKRKKRTDRMGFIGFMCARHVVEEESTTLSRTRTLCLGRTQIKDLPPSLPLSALSSHPTKPDGAPPPKWRGRISRKKPRARGEASALLPCELRGYVPGRDIVDRRTGGLTDRDRPQR